MISTRLSHSLLVAFSAISITTSQIDFAHSATLRTLPENHFNTSRSVKQEAVNNSSRLLYVYFVGETPQGLRLYREMVSTNATSNFGFESLNYLINARAIPSDPDYDNLWSGGSRVNKITIANSIATVDVSILHFRVNAEEEQAAINQLVWTLTANDPTIKAVTFRHYGLPISTFAGNVMTSKVFRRSDSTSTLASVWVDAVSKIQINPITMTGTACTFEANVSWLLYKNGLKVRQGATLASGACPTRGKWSVLLRELPPALYTFVARDISPKDGSVISKDTKSFIVR